MEARVSEVAVPMQLPLGIALRPGYSFENFYAAGQEEAMAAIQRAAEGAEPYVYLWGPPASGKTHLLQAVCRDAAQRGEGVAYLPLAELVRYSPPVVLDGLESLGLVAVDDLDIVAGRQEWEQAFFHFYNRMHDQGARLVAAGQASPLDLGLVLPDLRSRLAWGPVFHLRVLDDAGRIAALQLQARQRGLELSTEVAQFLFKRYPRDLTALCELLDRLDRASLAAQRRLTIPFVKEVLGV